MRFFMRARGGTWAPCAKAALLLLALGLMPVVAPPPAAAQGLGLGVPASPIDIQADQYEFEPTTGRAYGRGNLRIAYQDIVLTADEAEANLKSRDVVARGNVTMRRGLFEWRGSEITGNLARKEFTVSAYEATTGKLYVKGDKGVHHSDGRVEVGQTQLTTCEYVDHPHYSLYARRVLHFPDGAFRAHHVIYKIGPVPVFYMPVVVGSTDAAAGFEIKPGYESDWGPYLLLARSWRLNKQVTTKFRLDLRGYRGIAVGNETNIRTTNSNTDVLLYGMVDTDTPETSSGYNRRFESEDVRYRARVVHRQDLRDDVTLRLRLDKLSDIDMLENWFRREFQGDPQPSSLADVTWERERFALSLGFRPRLNDFFTEVEQLPTLTFQMPRQPLLGSRLFYQGRTSLASLEMNWREFDRDRFDPLNVRLIDPENYDAVRLDSLHMLYLPFSLGGVLQAVPRAGVRLTAYSDSSERPITLADLERLADIDDPDNPDSPLDAVNYDDDGGTVVRFASEVGLELSSKFWRTWPDARSAWWQIDGLRHVVEPYANYTLAPEPSEDRDNLYFFDEVDRLIEQNFIRFGLRQRLQTRRSNRIYTLASMETYADFHFVKEEGFDNLGALGGRFNFDPKDSVGFWGRMEADMGEGSFNRGEIGLRLGRREAVRFDISYLYRNDYVARTVYSMGSSLTDVAGDSVFAHSYARAQWLRTSLAFPLNPLTRGRIGYDFDLEEGKLASQYYEVIRDLHCWMGSLRLQEEEGEVSVMLLLYLKAYPGIGLHTSM
jgi:lipopolysaccharide assembly outer membrane protein LptD (OstA)